MIHFLRWVGVSRLGVDHENVENLSHKNVNIKLVAKLSFLLVYLTLTGLEAPKSGKINCSKYQL